MLVKPLITLSVLLAAEAYSQVNTTYLKSPNQFGESLQETVWTPSNVTSTRVSKLFSHPVDGQVYAQPLYVSSIAVPGRGRHNVILVATAHGTVYAFDADSSERTSESLLWRVSLADEAAGERPANLSDVLGCASMVPEIGVTGTLLIDPASNTLYVVALTVRRETLFHRVHALDIGTGAQRPGSPVVIDAPLSGAREGLACPENEYYNKEVSLAQDSLGSFVNYTAPTVANGKIYLGVGNSLTVFGLSVEPHQASVVAVVNAASFRLGPVAPGSIVSIFGQNLTPFDSPFLCVSFCRTLGGVALFINGIQAPLQYVSPSQINAQIPFEVTAGTAIGELRSALMADSGIQFQVAAVAPGIFGVGPYQGAGYNMDGSINTPNNPAPAGSLVTVYLTGQGRVQPTVATGESGPSDPPAQSVYPISARVGGRPATVVSAALSPGSVGLFQAVVAIPSLLGSATYALDVSVNGVFSNTRFISVSAAR
jgi:uncharacterized protein (TIGR03437 family)